MPRETAHAKARRLLTEGRLNVRHVSERSAIALCRGDSALVYRLGFDRGSWFCSCACATDQCSHLKALRLIVLEPEHGRNASIADTKTSG